MHEVFADFPNLPQISCSAANESAGGVLVARGNKTTRRGNAHSVPGFYSVTNHMPPPAQIHQKLITCVVVLLCNYLFFLTKIQYDVKKNDESKTG
jgi:hypothetical protein